MRGLDETDREILQLLLEDGRRSYSEIAEAVDLSAPAVSDRIDRLQEVGVIRQFTVDIDRSLVHDGTAVLVTIQGEPTSGTEIRDHLIGSQTVEYVFQTVDDTVVCTLTAPENTVGEFLSETLPMDLVQSYDVQLLQSAEWTPHIENAQLAPECVECGNTVSREGEQERLDGELYHFCCSSCRDSFLEQYETLRENA